MNKTLQILLNIIAGVVALVFFVILLFPLDSVISHYLANLEKQTKGQYRISVSSIDASLIFDTQFEDFRLYQKGKEVFYAPTIKAGISLFSLLSSTINVSFDASYKSGSLSGRVQLAEDESVYDIDVHEVDLDDLPFLTQSVSHSNYPLALKGKLEGNIYLLLTRDIKSSEGQIKLKVANAKMDAIHIKELNFELPAVELSEKKTLIELEGSLSKGLITVSKFLVPGPDLKFKLNGTVSINRQFDLLRSSFEGEFSFSPTLAEKIPFMVLIEGQKSAEGAYPLHITGSLKSPKIKIGELDLSKVLNI